MSNPKRKLKPRFNQLN